MGINSEIHLYMKYTDLKIQSNYYSEVMILIKIMLAKTSVWRYNMRPDNIKINIKFKGDDIFNDK